MRAIVCVSRETDVRERLAAVGGLVDAVAERRRLPIVRLTCADVDDVGIRRMNRDVADRRAAVRLEDRLERDGVVIRLEHAADRVADVDDVRIARRHLDVVDAAAHARRSDRAEPEAGEQRIRRHVEGRLARRGAAPLRAQRNCDERQCENWYDPSKVSRHDVHPEKSNVC